MNGEDRHEGHPRDSHLNRVIRTLRDAEVGLGLEAIDRLTGHVNLDRQVGGRIAPQVDIVALPFYQDYRRAAAREGAPAKALGGAAD